MTTSNTLHRRTLLGAGSALLLAGGVRAEADPFRIGWVRPTTGRLASSFAPLYVGGLIAIEEINAAGGILGRPIVRDEQDDEGSPAKEPAIVRKLADDGIRFICGPTGSSQALAALATTTPAKIINTTYGLAAALGDGHKYPYHYQMIFNSDQQAIAIVRYLVDVLKLRKIGVLQESTAYGEEITVSTRRELTKRGLDPVGVQVFPISAPDLNGYVSNLQKAGAEGLCLYLSNTPNSVMAFNAMNGLNWHPPIAGHTSLFDEALLKLVAPDALRNVAGTYYRSFTWSDNEAPGQRQQDYARKIATYPEARGVMVNAAFSPNYDFLKLLSTVIAAEKTDDPERIKPALDAVRNYPGMLGAVNFSPDNHCAISADEMVMASVASGTDPRAQGIFRARA
jgi:ABC-type branched-subunit amino acid transport system substrate-binding protein